MRRYYHKPHAPDPRKRHPCAQSASSHLPLPRWERIEVRVNPAGRGYSGLPTNTNDPVGASLVAFAPTNCSKRGSGAGEYGLSRPFCGPCAAQAHAVLMPMRSGLENKLDRRLDGSHVCRKTPKN